MRVYVRLSVVVIIVNNINPPERNTIKLYYATEIVPQQFCQSVLYSTHELPHLRSLSYDGEDSSQARASESVTDTPMTATVNAIDSIKKLYRLTFEASTTSTHQQRRSSAATCSDMDEEPKFFTEDMLSLLTERISLKEEVAQLEENIRVIQR